MILGAILTSIAVVIALVAAQGIYRNWDVYMGRSKTFDAFPEHLDEVSEIENAFPDDSQYSGWLGDAFRRFKKFTKPWRVFGPRSKFWWARWNATPKTLIAIGGEGPWRVESGYREAYLQESVQKQVYAPWYLSRIQYWKRYSLIVQWPLQISGHIYWRKSDVPVYPYRPKERSLKKMLYGYGPMHTDADLLVWLFSFFIGGTFK